MQFVIAKVDIDRGRIEDVPRELLAHDLDEITDRLVVLEPLLDDHTDLERAPGLVQLDGLGCAVEHPLLDEIITEPLGLFFGDGRGVDELPSLELQYPATAA